ncbi:hypothetical protein Bbelb_189980 [Branchiostoma belcheri]|nr:hypothetical protein Bbelb_189980 [Branchiostoma belcheri]
MSNEASGFSFNLDLVHRALSIATTPLSRDVQTVYLVFSLLVAVGCGLLLIFLVWKKEYLQKPCHYLRCNLAVDDIIFTGCLIPMLMVPPLTTSMFGTYLMMAIELYYFICHPLHYHDKVTTKRVIIGIVAVRVFAVLVGAGPTIAGGLQSLPCDQEPKSNTAVMTINFAIRPGCIMFAVLSIFILYLLVFKEARKQQQRDERRNLWLCQTKAFKTIAPHVIVLAAQVITLLFLNVTSWALMANADAEKVSSTLVQTMRAAKLLLLTVSSMVNPVVYSFRQPEFRRALREFFGRPARIPPAPVPRVVQAGRQNVQMTVYSVAVNPGQAQGVPGRELAPEPHYPEEEGQCEEEGSPSQTQMQEKPPMFKGGQNAKMVILSVPGQVASSRESTSTPPSAEEVTGQREEEGSPSQTQKQETREDVQPPLSEHCKQKATLSSSPMLLTVQAEVYPTPLDCHDQKTVPSEEGKPSTPTEDVDIISLISDAVIATKSPALQPKTAWSGSILG